MRTSESYEEEIKHLRDNYSAAVEQTRRYGARLDEVATLVRPHLSPLGFDRHSEPSHERVVAALVKHWLDALGRAESNVSRAEHDAAVARMGDQCRALQDLLDLAELNARQASEALVRERERLARHDIESACRGAAEEAAATNAQVVALQGEIEALVSEHVNHEERLRAEIGALRALLIAAWGEQQ
jgi:hypothetical protein